MNGRNSLSLEKAINPETGEEDLIGALKYVIRCCNQEPFLSSRQIKRIKGNIPEDDIHHIIEGGMSHRLEELKISKAYLAEFLLLMQNLTICRSIKRGIFWQIIDVRFIDSFINEMVVEKALKDLLKRRNQTDLIRQQSKRIEYLESILQEGDEHINEKVVVDFPDDVLEEAMSALSLANAKIDVLNGTISQKNQDMLTLQEMVEELRQELASKAKSQKDVSSLRDLIGETLRKCN